MTISKYDHVIKEFAGKAVFTTKDARAAGISSRMLAYFCKKGLIERISRGIYKDRIHQRVAKSKHESLRFSGCNLGGKTTDVKPENFFSRLGLFLALFEGDSNVEEVSSDTRRQKAALAEVLNFLTFDFKEINRFDLRPPFWLQRNKLNDVKREGFFQFINLAPSFNLVPFVGQNDRDMRWRWF